MNRRTVRFATLDEALKDARSLLRSGYDRAGNWSLGQVGNHLTGGIEITLNGYGSWIPVFLQRAFIATYFRLFFLGRIGNTLGMRMPTGEPQKIPIDDEVGLERLTAAIGAVKEADAPHWTRMHLWHCEHHLSFLIPRNDGATTDEPSKG